MSPHFQKPTPPLGPCSSLRPSSLFSCHSPVTKKATDSTLWNTSAFTISYLGSFPPHPLFPFAFEASAPNPLHTSQVEAFSACSIRGRHGCLPTSAGSTVGSGGQGLGWVLPGSRPLNQRLEIKMHTHNGSSIATEQVRKMHTVRRDTMRNVKGPSYCSRLPPIGFKRRINPVNLCSLGTSLPMMI